MIEIRSANGADQIQPGATPQEQVLITKHGRRVAEVKPVLERKPKRLFRSGKGFLIYMAPDFDTPLSDFKGRA